MPFYSSARQPGLSARTPMHPLLHLLPSRRYLGLPKEGIPTSGSRRCVVTLWLVEAPASCASPMRVSRPVSETSRTTVDLDHVPPSAMALMLGSIPAWNVALRRSFFASYTLSIFAASVVAYVTSRWKTMRFSARRPESSSLSFPVPLMHRRKFVLRGALLHSFIV